MKTLTGVRSSQIMRELSRVLGPNAYKQNGDRTELKAAFTRLELARVLGPCGLGWGITIDDIVTKCFQSSNGKDLYRTRARGHFWYILHDDQDAEKQCAFPVQGGGINVSPEYVERSAVTSLTSQGARELGYQWFVYADIFSPTVPGSLDNVIAWLRHRDIVTDYLERLTYIIPNAFNAKILRKAGRELESKPDPENIYERLCASLEFSTLG